MQYLSIGKNTVKLMDMLRLNKLVGKKYIDGSGLDHL